MIEARPASGHRDKPLFPPVWTRWNGPPPLDGDGRAAWIKTCITEGEARRASGETIAWLAPTGGIEARTRLQATRRVPPAIAARLRLLELHAKAPPWLGDDA